MPIVCLLPLCMGHCVRCAGLVEHCMRSVAHMWIVCVEYTVEHCMRSVAHTYVIVCVEYTVEHCISSSSCSPFSTGVPFIIKCGKGVYVRTYVHWCQCTSSLLTASHMTHCVGVLCVSDSQHWQAILPT